MVVDGELVFLSLCGIVHDGLPAVKLSFCAGENRMYFTFCEVSTSGRPSKVTTDAEQVHFMI